MPSFKGDGSVKDKPTRWTVLGNARPLGKPGSGTKRENFRVPSEPILVDRENDEPLEYVASCRSGSNGGLGKMNRKPTPLGSK